MLQNPFGQKPCPIGQRSYIPTAPLAQLGQHYGLNIYAHRFKTTGEALGDCPKMALFGHLELETPTAAADFSDSLLGSDHWWPRTRPDPSSASFDLRIPVTMPCARSTA